MTKPKLTQAEVRYHFNYNNGYLYWKNKRIGRLQGSIAGTIRKDNRTTINLNGVIYLAHRLIFLYHNGYLPEFIDHKDRNPLDNRIDNLRPATTSQNNANSNEPDNINGVKHSSVFRGVSFDKARNKWMSKISKDNKSINLGRFINEIDAADAYNKAAIELHGEYAHLNILENKCL